MKKKLKLSFLISMVFLLVFSLTNVFAAPDRLELVLGNDKDIESEGIEGTIQLKRNFNNPTAGVYTVNDNNVSITFNLSSGKTLTSFTLESLDPQKCYGVKSVFLKGGPAGNLYTYDIPIIADGHDPENPINLVSPLNPGQNVPDISHVSFYYVPVKCPENEKCYDYNKETAWAATGIGVNKINAKGNWATFVKVSDETIYLYAGQRTEVGTVTVEEQGDMLHVTYHLNGNHLLLEAHLFVGGARPEHSIPGRYEYKANASDIIDNKVTFIVDKPNSEELFIAAHAVVDVAFEVSCESETY
jgi:hypothetical protein